MSQDRNSGGLQLKFWGVRGSTPTPQQENLRYGGNTPCLEVRYRDQPPLVFDAGSGIRPLGLSLSDEFVRRNGVSVFLTHFHWDHIQGIPFFQPLYAPGLEIAFHSVVAAAQLQEILQEQMLAPYFPVPWETVPSCVRCIRVGEEGVRTGDLSIRPFPVWHPNGAVGYRIESPEALIVLATDHEHGNQAHDTIVRSNSRDADILIFDAQFTPEEYAQRKGWGHSTWLQATQVAREAKARQLILFHHDPQHDDRTVDRIVAQAAAEFPKTIGAREGWSICL